MRIPQRGRTYGMKFNITPLIDIVFLLLIFFLVTSHFARTQEVDAIELPSATQGKTADTSPRRIVISILPDRTLRVGGTEVSIAQIESQIAAEADAGHADLEVQVRGDRRTPYQLVEPILLACARSGITRFGFNVVEQPAP